MENGYSADDLLDFLRHASERGLMPAATAEALAVACRNVFGVLDGSERNDLRTLDIPAVLRRFQNKRAKDFNPTSLKAYGNRVQRAIGHFISWRDDPANFSVRTRNTVRSRQRERSSDAPPSGGRDQGEPGVTTIWGGPNVTSVVSGGGYQSAFPIRPGIVVTISNIPADLTPAEAKRLGDFVRMLAIDS